MVRETLWCVKISGWYNSKYPQAKYRYVLACNGHDALDKVKDSLEEDETLYDEEIQRSIVNGEIDEYHVERTYDDYIFKVQEYIGT